MGRFPKIRTLLSIPPCTRAGAQLLPHERTFLASYAECKFGQTCMREWPLPRRFSFASWPYWTSSDSGTEITLPLPIGTASVLHRGRAVSLTSLAASESAQHHFILAMSVSNRLHSNHASFLAHLAIFPLDPHKSGSR